jgi:dihydrofolate reductase
MTLTLIAALDEDQAIGRSTGGLPWHLPDETAHFRAYCAGQWLLAGRRTFGEMQGWFQPDQQVAVLTRSPAPLPATNAGTPAAVPSLAAALALARAGGAAELVVIGGARTYAEALPHADGLVLSRIALSTGGDVVFPPVAWTEWTLAHSEPGRRDRATGTAFSIETWKRR